ncbi:MAG TPA: sugar phosphate isomerase/epimerase [Planctomycetaceae bacterium]|jgi:inosose dehydratase|nr:sugar phosphate isomerase/epimerase [Planctomycetaceae bacterium]
MAVWRVRGTLRYPDEAMPQPPVWTAHPETPSHAQEQPTMFDPDAQPLSRRQVLKFAAAGAAATFAPRMAVAGEEKDPYAGLKMGMQSYSLRAFDAPTALRHTKELGLKYWESFPKHIPMTTLPKQIADSKALLKENGIVLMSYGVVDFDANETKARQRFDFAKAIGLPTMSANPRKNKETFDLLDKLVAEYDIAIAIHNHGPHALYSKISDVVDIVKDRHPKIGACVDTGHYLRSDENPVEAIERLSNRLYGVHLKDVRTVTENGRRKKIFTIVGQGDLDVVGCLRVLKKLNYPGCVAIEYEENEQNPLSDIAVSLSAVRDAAAKLG